ncbi:MAG: hypothetical protein KDI72_14380 [Xanthomonadales bacterium]|nr:hypothetical protein [Xanthomonadales bacterium]MCB1577884.1 hypothetical protein [Xanthomonadales bacterium]
MANGQNGAREARSLSSDCRINPLIRSDQKRKQGMKNLNHMLAISLCAMASIAVAKDGDPAATQKELLRQDGYIQLSDGFYVKRVGTQESYMALGRAGTQAMSELLTDQRDASRQAIESRGGSAAQVIDKYDSLIKQLNIPAPKVSGSQEGDCSGTSGSPVFIITAQASGGTFALANSRNDPGIINTTNHTEAWTVNRAGTVTADQISTTYGGTPSQSQASVPNTAMACETHAIASISCPGGNGPAMYMFVTDLKWWDCRQ